MPIRKIVKLHNYTLSLLRAHFWPKTHTCMHANAAFKLGLTCALLSAWLQICDCYTEKCHLSAPNSVGVYTRVAMSND